MYEKLNTAIHQFAKRQMTWFRRMEKKGIKIQWLDGMNEPEKKLLYKSRILSEELITPVRNLVYLTILLSLVFLKR